MEVAVQADYLTCVSPGSDKIRHPGSSRPLMVWGRGYRADSFVTIYQT